MGSLWYLPFLVAAFISFSTKPIYILIKILLRNHLCKKRYDEPLKGEFITVSYYIICQFNFSLAILIGGVTGIAITFRNPLLLSIVVIIFAIGIYYQALLYDIGPFDFQERKRKLPVIKKEISHSSFLAGLNVFLQFILLILGIISRKA